MPLQSLPVVDAPSSISSNPSGPLRKRHKGLAGFNDIEAWNHDDKELIAAAKATWRSDVYEHYNIRVERWYDHRGEPSRLVFRFECRFNDPHHDPVLRGRMRSSEGTRQLKEGIDECNQRHGIIQPDAEVNDMYTEHAHRALLLLQAACNHRPFQSLVDPLHQAEVQLLRPGTMLPSAATISNDARRVHTDAPERHAEHFLQNVPGALHLAVDGWTCPTSESYLGVIVFWNAPGERKVSRAILDFIMLTESHTGNYLAERIHDCLSRFGIADKVLSVCCDNAANNGTLVTRLQELLPNFEGPSARVRCLPHVVNLVAKSFMSLFTSPQPSQSALASSGSSGSHSGTGDLVSGDIDPDKLEYDNTVIRGATAQAIQKMEAAGLVLTSSEMSASRKIIPGVARIARRVHDSATLTQRFRELIIQDPALQGCTRSLTRLVVTRWNSYRAALDSCIYFQGPVQMLTSSSQLGLRSHALTDEQWEIGEELRDVLEIFQGITDCFSQAEVPLIHDALPELLSLRTALYDVRDDRLSLGLRSVTRVAAEAALTTLVKYLNEMLESDIYVVAIVMCPDRKLEWFSRFSNDFGDARSLRARVISAFERRYPSLASQPLEEQSAADSQSSANISDASTRSDTMDRRRILAARRHATSLSITGAVAQGTQDQDTIEAYLDTPTVPLGMVNQAGGVLGYWSGEHATRPRIAQMALDYLTSPASSVDAERAFSCGRLMINHLQHRMSPQTFQAQMVIGSWFGTPLLPNVDSVASIIQDHM